MGELLELTRDEWLLAALATVLCVGGLLLPKAGNLLGQLFMGEDPAVLRWRRKRAEMRDRRREQRLARKALKRARKRARKDAARARKAARAAGNTPDVTPAPDTGS